ncbi:uncharacterized protein LOC118180099 [Stegodyphus dumicola]|uniref:uncharacterized protein LOC118180099 n=1 Tax=Stegodyphus dumicola TaxID=202533 RepID=UPI0015AEE243|nr:uncharacterized protein LOC118180099 [Stegodyphus dumicola]
MPVLFILSIIISLSFVKLPYNTDSVDEDLNFNEDILGPDNAPSMTGFRKKFNRLKNINLKTLKRSKNCRFECQPAIENHVSDARMSLSDKRPYAKIMINHCLKCLRSKGYMEKVMDRSRYKRDLQMTPYIEPTNPLKDHPVTITTKQGKHFIFGGWLSDMMNPNQKQKNQQDFVKDLEFRKSRILLALPWMENSKLLKATKEPIVIGGKLDDDYENNYEDDQNDDDVPDLDKLEKKTQDSISYFIFGAFAFLCVLSVFVFPVTDFLRMFVLNCRSNSLIICDILRCRDPKYRLVKEMCETSGVPITSYKVYKKLMERYELESGEDE